MFLPVYLIHTIRIHRPVLQYRVPPSLAGTSQHTDRLCSQKIFLGLDLLAGTNDVSRVYYTDFLSNNGTMLFAQPLFHVVRLPCLGLKSQIQYLTARVYQFRAWAYRFLWGL